MNETTIPPKNPMRNPRLNGPSPLGKEDDGSSADMIIPPETVYPGALTATAHRPKARKPDTGSDARIPIPSVRKRSDSLSNRIPAQNLPSPRMAITQRARFPVETRYFAPGIQMAAESAMLPRNPAKNFQTLPVFSGSRWSRVDGCCCDKRFHGRGGSCRH